ncbi:MAG: glutamate/aspartate ABC transporter substrate-binding protein [Betaproteobacteria bacterium]
MKSHQSSPAFGRRINRAVSASLFVFCAQLFSVPNAGAQELTGTLKKIKDSGVIILGHRESSIPFSYYDDQQKVVGYSHDLQLKIVDAIKQELKLPQLTIRYMPVTSQNRIPLVQNGSVDLECGSTTHNTERAKQVSFSNSFFLVGLRTMVKKNSGINELTDLAGKTVVTTAGTSNERLLRQINDDKKLGMSIISAKDHGESFLTLESGRAAGFFMDDALLYGERAKAKKANDWVVIGKPEQEEVYGCMLKKDDVPFKALVDGTLAGVMKTGEVIKIYNRWFNSPIPPKGLNLAYPLSPEMAALYKNPNDKPIQ